MADPTPEERAAGIADNLDIYLRSRTMGPAVIIAAHIREAATAARAKAFEEAAQIADWHDLSRNGETTEGVAFNVANAIRARAKEAPHG